jgi:hypothetical protein
MHPAGGNYAKRRPGVIVQKDMYISILVNEIPHHVRSEMDNILVKPSLHMRFVKL